MWKTIIGYVLIFLGFFVTLFFRKYTGELIPYPFLYWVMGIGMIVSGLLLLRNAVPPAEKKYRQQVEELKQQGEKITVDFSVCELKEHHYQEEQEADSTKAGWTSLVSPLEYHAFSAVDSLKTEQVQVIQTVIIFSYHNVRTGQTEKFFSPVISKDKITLSFYLDTQKNTTLYIDRANRSRYYFDLEFLYT